MRSRCGTARAARSSASRSDAFYALNGADLFGLPITGFYVLALSVVLWFVLEYLPIGRYFYAIGANPKAAELNGIPVRRYTILAFVASGLLTAFAGVLLAAKLRIGQASVGLEYLLPALVGAFLGSTTIKPGRVNVWGTVVGVTILAIGISGIQQFGALFFVEPLVQRRDPARRHRHRRLRATQARSRTGARARDNGAIWGRERRIRCDLVQGR